MYNFWQSVLTVPDPGYQPHVCKDIFCPKLSNGSYNLDEFMYCVLHNTGLVSLILFNLRVKGFNKSPLR